MRLLALMLVSLILDGCTKSVGPADSVPKVDFEPRDVVIAGTGRQTVLTGFLLGGPTAELVVVGLDDGVRRLRLYSLVDSAWSQTFETTLGPEVLFVDVAGIDGRDRLITCERDGLNWFDPESATERPLAAVRSGFNPTEKDEVPHVDMTRDLNGDDRDDLVVLGVHGFQVFIQREGGAFADPVRLSSSTDMSRIYGADGYRYDPWSQSRVHEIDYNQDGRVDLVSWNEDHFEVHLQNAQGLFAPVTTTFTTDVPFDSDDLAVLTRGDMTGRVLHSLADLSGDGVADLVVYSLDCRSFASRRSSYEVHLGTPTPDGRIVFATDVDLAFDSDDRIQLAMDRHDFDGDGHGDVMLTTIALGYLERSFIKRVARRLRGGAMSFGMMGDDIWLALEFYRMQDGGYAAQPDAEGRVQFYGTDPYSEPGWVPLDIALKGGTHESRDSQPHVHRGAYNRTLLIGDVTGDGRTDLIRESTNVLLDVYVGVPGPGLFARRPQTIRISPPLHDTEYVWLADINGDGRQDVVMVLPPGNRDHAKPSVRVTTLIAR